MPKVHQGSILGLFLIKNCISGWEKRVMMTLNKYVEDVSLEEFSNTNEKTKENMQRNHEIKHKTQSGNLTYEGQRRFFFSK